MIYVDSIHVVVCSKWHNQKLRFLTGQKRKELEEAEENKARKKSKVGGQGSASAGSASANNESTNGVPLSLNFVPMSVAGSG